MTFQVFKVDFNPPKIVRQIAYDDGLEDEIPLADLIANNITFQGGTGLEIVPKIFQDVVGGYEEYESTKLFVEEQVVKIKKNSVVHHTKYLKFTETDFNFPFYYPIQITSCGFLSPANAPVIKIEGDGFTSGITRGQSYFEDQKISNLFTITLKMCKVKKETITLVKDETGAELDTKSGLDVVTYDKDKDLLRINRTAGAGKYEFFVQGTTNAGMIVHYPIRLTMKPYFNPAPVFAEEPAEPLYLFSELDELAMREGRVETKTIVSPKVIDNEGDLIYFEFSGFEACPAITCEGFGAEDETIIDHFKCNLNERYITKDCNGTHNIVVNFLDESVDPSTTNQATVQIEINFIFEGREEKKSKGSFAGVVIQEEESSQEKAGKSEEQLAEELPPPELEILPMTPDGQLIFTFNQDMAIPEGGLDYQALISFSMKSSADNSIKKAEFVKDPEEARQRRMRRLQMNEVEQTQSRRRSLGWIKDDKITDINEYAAYWKRRAEEDYEAVWGKSTVIPKAADALSCFWYVESHTSKELKFKFSFDKPDSVSSGSFGQDQIIVDIKDLDQFESSSGEKISPDTFEGGKPRFSKGLPPIVSNPATAEALDESADLMTKLTNIVSSGNLLTSLILGGSMQYLWGMIRAMQMITMMSLVQVTLPAYAQVFFAGAILFANMDVFSGEALYSDNLDFKETEALNERFERMGMDSQNFVYNSGSYFILQTLIYLTFYLRRIANYICTKYAHNWWVRSFGLYIYPHKEDSIEIFKASVKLFQESYFDNMMANILGLSGMYYAYKEGEFHLLWSSSHNILCSTLTLIWSILHLLFPVWQYWAMSAMANYQEEGIADSDYKANIYYKVLCEGVATYNTTTFLYNFIFVVQRFLIAITLIVLREFPMAQFCIFIFISMYRIQYIIKYWPFKEAKDNAVELFNELTILLVICFMHSMLIANLSKDEKISLGWALIIGSAVNIVGNMMIVIYFSSQEIGSACRKSYEKHYTRKDIEFRLFNDNMILPSTSYAEVKKMREEYKALEWMRGYMPQRNWMVRNQIDMKEFADEIYYQTLEVKFQFTKKRQQIMMEYSFIKASKVLLERDEVRIAQDHIKAIKEEKRLKREKQIQEIEERKRNSMQQMPEYCYGDEEKPDSESEEEVQEEEKEEDLIKPVFKKHKFGSLLKRNNLVQRAYSKKIAAIKEESLEQMSERSSEREEKVAKFEADKEERIQKVKDEAEINLWEQIALQKQKKDQILSSGRVLMVYDKDKFFSMDKFSDLIMGDNFAKMKNGEKVCDNKHNYESKKKYGVVPKAVMDLRFMSDNAKQEQKALENEIIDRMEMTQEQIDQEMINETVSSMVLSDGGCAGQIAAVALVLAEIKEFRNFVITSPDAANEKNHGTFFIRRIIKAILAKQITKLHKHTKLSIKTFYLEWKYNKDEVYYASEFWRDLNVMFNKELSPKLAPDFKTQPWENSIDKMQLFNQCFPQTTSLLFETLLRGKLSCSEHNSEDDPLIMNYTKINAIFIDIENFEAREMTSLGQAITHYFEDCTVDHYCEKCKKETEHDQEQLQILVFPVILTISVPRLDGTRRYDNKLYYPITINFMDRFSKVYAPVYELFAVIVFRGNALLSKRDKANYVAIIKRHNGDVIEFDPAAEGPKVLSGDNDLLKERRTVEMLFYREVRFDEQEDDSESSSGGSSSNSDEESKENDAIQDKSSEQDEFEMVQVKTKLKQIQKNKVSKHN